MVILLILVIIIPHIISSPLDELDLIFENYKRSIQTKYENIHNNENRDNQTESGGISKCPWCGRKVKKTRRGYKKGWRDVLNMQCHKVQMTPLKESVLEHQLQRLSGNQN